MGKQVHNSTELKRFLRMAKNYLRPYRISVVLLLVAYAVYTILVAIQPLILAPILEIALHRIPINPEENSFGGLDLNNIGIVLLAKLGLENEDPLRATVILAFLYLVVSIAGAGTNFANYLLAIKIKIGAGRDIQVDLFKHLFSLSLDFFHSQKLGEIVARLDRDTINSIGGFELTLRNLFVSPLLIIYYGYLLVITNINLTIFVLIAAVMNYLLTQVLRNPIRKRMLDLVNMDAEISAFLQEKLNGARVVKTFVTENFEGSFLEKLAIQVKKINMRFGFFKHIDDPVTSIISASINVAILIFSASELFSGRLSLSGFLLYLFVGRSILGPLAMLAQTYNNLQSTLATGIRVRELFDISPTIVSGTRPVHDLTKEVRFENVSFGYSDFPVLHDISFKIKKGEITALVGPSGAGKSTITDLLLRFYDVDSGSIVFDNHDLREYNISDYRRLFGVVAQENVLFNSSIAENISYGTPNIPLKRIVDAAMIANAHDFISEFPLGYQTIVGDRGSRLSGGQRQRIAIARAVAHNPKILILDEATSSLDSQSEHQVQLAIDRAIRSTTAVVIAHRLSTVTRAHQIIVIDRGSIIDIGTHQELIQRCDLYKQLVRLQFKDPFEDLSVLESKGI